MEKTCKRITSLLVIIAFTLFNLFTPFMYVKAKTLGDLKKELEKFEADQKKQEQAASLTQSEIAQTKNNISNIQATIKQIDIDIKAIYAQIEQLNLDIAASEKEIKSIVKFLQVANGESAYMEYAFGAQDFTDFIYRVAITEQLADYNNQLIEKFNKMIEEGKQKQIELSNKEKQLQKEQADLEVQLKKLGNKLQGIYDIVVDIKDAIKTQKEIIKGYQDRGCKDNEDIRVCGSAFLPNNTQFWRPVNQGQVSSVLGNRCFTLNGSWYCDYHTGTDIAGMYLGSPVYATASGTVAAITWKASCGGNQVLIHHKVNNKYYTSQYLHLLNIYVKKGDIVNKNTVIGTVGGANTPWDGCSTGTHLHFGINSGLVGVDYMVWSSAFYSRLINPQTVVNLPSGVWFRDRLTKY